MKISASVLVALASSASACLHITGAMYGPPHYNLLSSTVTDNNNVVCDLGNHPLAVENGVWNLPCVAGYEVKLSQDGYWFSINGPYGYSEHTVTHQYGNYESWDAWFYC
ncbi:hypothetical protein NLG97_g3569 [Lecanicillium saksenae]|uniref:Uncharacterized protein n=1 Tax=Lecanicillium saksenae TaxID=468837 RepID=A0ACC1QXP4_9HYPO|nr:hypothetical protein NLG97_g3569 [Lecanicillium saksenae]